MSVARSVVFFADGSEETHTVLRKVLFSRTTGTLLDRFLEQARVALQNELRAVPSIDRDGLPDFNNLAEILSDSFDESRRHPSLHPTEIVLVQLGQFIAAHEKQPHEPYPTATENVVVGICFGELSACAVSLAHSLVELIPVAVEAVRIAFRCGILASRVGDSLDKRSSPALSWSTVLSRETGVGDEEVLERLAQEAGILKHYRPYLSASSRKTVTVGAPPSSLARLLSHPTLQPYAKSRRDVKIYAPYHAPRYFTEGDAADLAKESRALLTNWIEKSWQAGQRTFIGCAAGDFYDAESPQDLFEQVVYNILSQPIRWDSVIQGCTKSVGAIEAAAWSVQPFAQTVLGSLLAKALTSAEIPNVAFDDQFGKRGSNDAQALQFPLAVVGMAGRFPQADDPDAFWEALNVGTDHHKKIPTERFNPDTHLVNPAFGCFLDKPGLFDAQFFNISPREALQTDPGQRLALVTAYEALENSGFVANRTPSTSLNRVGTFYGQVADEYKEQNMAQKVDTYFIPGSMRAFGSGRINNFFKFGGPALNCDTACSSSFVALHNACNAIWNRDCDTAVVGGMNICTSSDNFNGLTAGHFLSPTGGCKTWDETADGYTRGEAVASVVIKPLDAAHHDNDNILGVITSMGTNYSRHAESITRPHAGDQEKLYRQVLFDAGITPYDVDYVEMHGTGTQAGDTVEMTSITSVFAPTAPVRAPDNPLYISATKSNVGHGESASGVTALVKTLLVLREETLPPHVGIKTRINPKLPALDPRNVRIATSSTPLPSKRRQGAKRHVMLNNFSAAGGNTACVLEEAPSRPTAESQPRALYTVAVTAKSAASMAQNVENLVAYIDRHPDVSLADMSYTTTARRTHYVLRKSFVASSVPDLRKQLSAFDKNEKITQKKAPKVAFCFSGQGAFYKSLARELIQTSEAFKTDLIRLDGIAEAHGFGSFLPALDERMNEEPVSQKHVHLATCAVQIALTRLLWALGVSPSLSIGHSLGEYAALHASGVLSEHDALYLVGQRAALIEEHCTKGSHSMLVVQAGEDQLRTILGEDLASYEVACLNTAQQTVLTGQQEKVGSLQSQLKQQGILCKRLDLPFAFHSSQMDPVLDLFEECAAGVKFQTPSVPVASPSLGSLLPSPDTLGPLYLRKHLRETNNFYGALTDCQKQGLVDDNTAWVEIGPHSLCLDMIKASFGGQLRTAPALLKGEDSWSTITKCVSSLFAWGADLTWQQFFVDAKEVRLLDLPTYAWNAKDYWIPYENDWLLNKTGAPTQSPAPSAPISLGGPETTTVQRLTARDISGDKVSLTFESDLTDAKLHSVISGHVINGSALCPASVYADIALTIADYVRKEYPVKVPASAMNVGPMEILRPILLPRERPSKKSMLRLTATADLSSGAVAITYSLMAAGQSSYRDTAKAEVYFSDSTNWVSDWSESAYLLESRIDTLSKDLITGSTNRFTRGLAYQLFGAFVEYDERYQGMKEILINIDGLEAVATLDLYKNGDAGVFGCSPFWIDSFMHLSGFILNVNDKFERQGIKFISDGWSSFKLSEDIDPTATYKLHFKVQDRGDSLFTGNAFIFRDNNIMGKVEGLRFKGVPLAVMNAIIPPPAGSKQAAAPAKSRTEPVKKASATKQQAPQPSKNQSSSAPAPSKPTNSFHDALAVIAEEVGTSVEDMSLESSPSELGIDSLLSLTLVSKLNNKFSMDLPPTIFSGDVKIGDLQKHFPSASSAESISSESTSPSGTSTPASSLDLNTESPSKPTVEVSNSQQSALRSLVMEEIGMNEEDLMAAEDLSQLGIDSLMTLTIVENARARLGIVIDLEMLGKGISMAELEEKLGFSSQPQAPPPQQKSTLTPKVPLSMLLQGSSSSQGPSLFLFPDGSGSASSYLAFPAISSKFKVYGLNSPYLKQGRDVGVTVEGMVDAWLSEIQAVQPNGPYYLAGWSAGGYYAYEVTKALLKSGQAVEKLIFIDTPPMNVYEAMPLDLLDWLDTNKVMGGEGKASPAWLVDHFEGTLKALTSYKPTPLQGSRLPQVSIVWASEGVLKSVASSVPAPPLTTKVSTFLTQQRNTDIPYGWEELVKGCELSVAGTKGNHFTMVLPPNNQTLTSLLGAALESKGGGAPKGFSAYTS